MTEAPPPRPTREDRLAAKLRENLRRRKAQARALDEPVTGAGAGANDGRDGAGALSKPPASG